MTHPPDDSTPPRPDTSEMFVQEIKPMPTPVDLPRAVAARGNEASATRSFINERLNSRLTNSLPAGAWKVRWQAEVAGGVNPTFVLHDGGRILAQGADLWQLFDMDGKPLATEPLGAGGVLLDAANANLYYAAPNGTITGARLSDGRRAFILNVLFGPEFERLFLARRGRRMLVVSVERRVDQHSPHEPTLSLVEIQDLGNPPAVDDLDFLTSAKRLGSVERRTTLLRAALHEDVLVLAIPDEVQLIDMDLKHRGSLKTKLDPVALSLDEAGRIYLIARTGGRSALWVLTPRGERLISFDLPADIQPGAIPPIIGYNHRVYIATANRVIAIDMSGKQAWDYVAGGHLAGATVTADDQLLVTAGTEIAAFDAAGKRRVLFNSGGDVLLTPAVLTAKGEMLVASRNRLYCLTPQQP